jgi:2-isopropylmalate synthase
VGAEASKIVLTARSGRSALAYRLQLMGFSFDRDEIDGLYDIFIQIADGKREVNNEDLELMAKKFKQPTV